MNSGKIIRQILKEKGISLSWLANKLGLKIQTLSSRLEKDLKLEFAIEICRELNISLDYIFERYKNQED